MKVFVLHSSAQPFPIAVVSDPMKVHIKTDNFPSGYGDGCLPSDAYTIWAIRKKMSEYKHEEMVGQWTRPNSSVVYTLVCYDVA